jgi:hypothetical protein
MNKKISTGLADLVASINNEVSNSIMAQIEDFVAKSAIVDNSARSTGSLWANRIVRLDCEY